MGSVIYPEFRETRTHPWPPARQCYARDWHRLDWKSWHELPVLETHPEFVAEERLSWPESARLILEICVGLWLVILLSIVW